MTVTISRFDVITRGLDTSNRPLKATRQMFQHFDRVNAHMGGILVPVQGSFNKGVSASAGTHDLAGCFDVRVWNLTTAQREGAQRAGRDPAIVGGAAWWHRTAAQGFDEHMHLTLLGDSPMTPQTEFQVSEYHIGHNGLANRGPDDFWRPSVIENYKYVEDDMFSDQDRATLNDIDKGLKAFRQAEFTRDQKEKAHDKERFSRMVTLMGQYADSLTVIINQTTDDATKTQLMKAKADILTALKDDPDVTGVDNPSDEGMAAST